MIRNFGLALLVVAALMAIGGFDPDRGRQARVAVVSFNDGEFQ